MLHINVFETCTTSYQYLSKHAVQYNEVNEWSKKVILWTKVSQASRKVRENLEKYLNKMGQTDSFKSSFLQSTHFQNLTKVRKPFNRRAFPYTISNGFFSPPAVYCFPIYSCSIFHWVECVSSQSPLLYHVYVGCKFRLLKGRKEAKAKGKRRASWQAAWHLYVEPVSFKANLEPSSSLCGI